MTTPSPTPPATPRVLTVTGTPLWRQVWARLGQDTDPNAGLLVALAQRPDDLGVYSAVNSIYPNFATDGPNRDRAICPTPFIIVYAPPTKASDNQGREYRVVVSIHDDRDHGEQRLPGLARRVKQWLIGGQGLRTWKPTDDQLARYYTGLKFEEETPEPLPDDTYGTLEYQAQFACRGTDFTGGYGAQG